VASRAAQRVSWIFSGEDVGTAFAHGVAEVVKIEIVVVHWEIPLRAKRWVLRLGILGVVVAGMGAIAYASVQNTFSSGQALTALALNQNFSDLDSRIHVLEDGGTPFVVQAGHASSADTASSLASPASGGLQWYEVSGGALAAPCTLAGIAGYPMVVDCVCPTGTFVVAGGAYAVGAQLRESRPVSTSTWRITCNNGSSDVLCSSYDLLCSHLGP
jgi:hypothetical protein